MQAISASPTIAPNNAAIMSRQLTMIGGTAAKPVIALYDWARPVYYVGSADPKTTNVRLTALGNGTGWCGKTWYGPIRWRSCITGHPASDGSAVIVDTEGKCVYDAWMLNKNSSYADPDAGWIGGLPFTDSTGIVESGEQMIGGNAANIAKYTSMVWPDECAAGQYGAQHGYVFCAPASLNNPNGGIPKWPATHCDGGGTHADDLVEGMRVQLNPSYASSIMSSLSNTDKCIAQACVTYGMIDGDSGGGNWALYAPGRQGYTNNPWNGLIPDPMATDYRPNFPVSQFRVLASTNNYYTEGCVGNVCGLYDGVPAPGNQPTLSSISPTSGTTAGGTVCTLTGTNLTGTTGVSFGGTAGTSIVNMSATQVRCTSPAKSAGTYPVTATTANGTSNGVNFTYNAPAGPTLSSIAPTSGTTAGGTVCTLTGTNLTGTTGVSFGGTAGTSIVNVSSTQVYATSPAKTAGTYSVTATTSGGTSSSVNYTYTTQGPGYTTTLYASADTFVVQNSAGTNLGNESYMQVQYNSGTNKQAYLKFDLSSVSGTAVTSAKLSCYLQGIYPASTTTVYAYGVSVDSWVETSITWNNRPTVGSLLATTSGILTAATRYEWDITSYVAGEFSGDKIVTVNLQDNVQRNIQTTWSSRQYSGTSQDPYLLVISQ